MSALINRLDVLIRLLVSLINQRHATVKILDIERNLVTVEVLHPYRYGRPIIMGKGDTLTIPMKKQVARL